MVAKAVQKTEQKRCRSDMQKWCKKRSRNGANKGEAGGRGDREGGVMIDVDRDREESRGAVRAEQTRSEAGNPLCGSKAKVY